MFGKPSLMTRIAIGKGAGLVFGLIGFICLPYFLPDADWMVRWGILLWYPTLGAVVGVFGVFTEHPVLKIPMPWWFRAPIIGGWMNFVLTFFAYEKMTAMLTTMFGDAGALNNPFWFVLEGAIIGLLIGFLATRFGGEGRGTVTE